MLSCPEEGPLADIKQRFSRWWNSEGSSIPVISDLQYGDVGYSIAEGASPATLLVAWFACTVGFALEKRLERS